MPALGFPLGGPLGGGLPVVTPPESAHVVAALSRLVEQYKMKPAITSILTSLAEQTQALDDVTVQMEALSSIDNSSGAQLDIIGSKVGEDRQGFNDGLYRLHLKARVLLNRSSASVPDLINLFETLIPGASLILTEGFPAGLTLRIAGYSVDPTFAPYLVSFLSIAKSAGVKAILEWSDVADSETFAFAGGTGKGFDEGSWASARFA